MATALQRQHGTWVVVSSFLLAALLQVLPLPEWIESYRPEWMALVLIYWVIALPYRVGLVSAWVLGFFIDVLEGSMLGLNAMTLSVVAYLALSLYQRLRMFTAVQQSSMVLILVGIHQLLSFWVLAGSNQNTPINLMFMISAFSSAIVWPFVFEFLRFFRRYFGVS